MRKYTRTRAPKSRMLEQEVEKQVAQGPQQEGLLGDNLDLDLQTYVESFLEEFSRLEQLGKTDLMSREGALRTLEMLDKAQEKIDRQLKTARALRGLLEQKQREQ